MLRGALVAVQLCGVLPVSPTRIHISITRCTTKSCLIAFRRLLHQHVQRVLLNFSWSRLAFLLASVVNCLDL